MRIVAALTFMGILFAGSASNAGEGDPLRGSFVVEASCGSAKKCGKILIYAKDLPKNAKCGTPPTPSAKTPPAPSPWVVPEGVAAKHRKAAAELAAQANKGMMEGTCYIPDSVAQ